jgi:hypothetical protein
VGPTCVGTGAPEPGQPMIELTPSQPEKSVAMSPKKIEEDNAAGWTFKAWVQKQPPECEIAGVSSTPAPKITNDPNTSTSVTTTNYTFTASWMEEQK